MKRYYLYERKNGNTHGLDTVIAIQRDARNWFLISTRDLDPQYFGEIVLKDEELNLIDFTYVCGFQPDGVIPESESAPFVCLVEHKRPL